jgi:hypothetical protein
MTKATRKHFRKPNDEEAEFIIELWLTRKFSTWDIGRFLQLHESVVDRLIHAAREIARILYREARS